MHLCMCARTLNKMLFSDFQVLFKYPEALTQDLFPVGGHLCPQGCTPLSDATYQLPSCTLLFYVSATSSNAIHLDCADIHNSQS